MESFDSTNFVKVRKVKGGPAPEPMQEQLVNSAKAHNKNDEWIAVTKSRLAERAKKLEDAFNAIN